MKIFQEEEPQTTPEHTSVYARLFQPLSSQPPHLQPAPRPSLKTNPVSKEQGRKWTSPHTPDYNRRIVSFVKPLNEASNSNIQSFKGIPNTWETSCQVLAVGSSHGIDSQKRLQLPPNPNNTQKARMIRQINIKIELLEAKARQPGIALEDLQPLREQIYDKFDNYQIGNYNFEKVRHAQRVSRLEPQLSHFAPKKQRRSIILDHSIDKNQSRASLISRHQDQSRRLKKLSMDSRKHQLQHIQTLESEIDESLLIDKSVRQLVDVNVNEDDLALLDRTMIQTRSDISDQDPRVMQLQENVRVMEERISFLIQRLEQGKREAQVHKQEKERVYAELKQTLTNNLLNIEKVEQLEPRVKEMAQECRRFQHKTQEAAKQIEQLQKVNSEYELQLTALAQEIRFLTQRVGQKEDQLDVMAHVLEQKIADHKQCNYALKNLEEQYTAKRRILLQDLYQSQNINNNLKKAIRQLTRRLQNQGVNLKIQQAQKLKQYIDDHAVIQQREIQTIDKSYSSMLTKHLQENKQLRKEKASLEHALVKWMVPFDAKCDCNLDSSEVALCQISSKVCGFTASRLSKAFLQAVASMQKIQKDSKDFEQESGMFRQRLVAMKQKYQEKITAKTQQVQKLSAKCKELLKYNKALRDQKQDLLHELTQQNQIKKQQTTTIHVHTLAIQSHNLAFNYPQVAQDCLPRGVRIDLQAILQNPSKFNLEHRVSMAISLLQYSNKINHYTKFQRKLPPLLPSRLYLKRTDFGIQVQLIKVQESSEDGLLYTAPQVLLGFNQTASSHCWSVGIILDQLLHGKQFYKRCDQVLSRTDNYYIRGQQFRRLQALHGMMRKNPKQRLGILEAKMLLEEYLAFLRL